MQTTAINSNKLQRLLLPLGLAVFAGMSVGEFPGTPGWVGGAGWLLLAATVFAAPSIVATAPRLPKRTGGLTILSSGVSLILIVTSVVIWANTR